MAAAALAATVFALAASACQARQLVEVCMAWDTITISDTLVVVHPRDCP